jgi:hypothetical protein
MMFQRKPTPRAEYRLRAIERVNGSATLAKTFPKLKSLSVNLEFFNPDGLTRNGQIKYKMHVAHAKSVVCFNCPSGECVGGDFDLTKALAHAVAGRQKIAVGEMRCQGSRRKAKTDHVPCQNLLRYKLTLGY